MCAPITHPVRVASHTSEGLILEVWCPAGNPVLDHISGVLDLVQPHREEKAQTTPMGKQRGLSPRRARKGGEATSEISVQRSLEKDWLRVTITRPEVTDSGKLASVLTHYLGRSRRTFRLSDKEAYSRIFRARDLERRRFAASKIIERMRLDADGKGRGPERVIELKAAYRDLVKRLFLPALPGGH